MVCRAVVWFSLVSLATPVASAQLTEREFQSLHAELQQPADAAWRTIPWKISLLEAQADAVAKKKPLFIWAMDGHPLGCT
jgi:hypothetical protein